MTTILVVDDESVTRRIVSHTLKPIDILVDGAGDATEAMDLARTQEYAMALVDINLPDMDGFALTRQLKALPQMADKPVVIFTARNHREDAMLAHECGAVDLLYKPFSTQELRDLVIKYTS